LANGQIGGREAKALHGLRAGKWSKGQKVRPGKQESMEVGSEGLCMRKHRQGSRKVKGQILSVLRQVTGRMRGQDELTKQEED
jgi:hypothetical protein